MIVIIVKWKQKINYKYNITARFVEVFIGYAISLYKFTTLKIN